MLNTTDSSTWIDSNIYDSPFLLGIYFPPLVTHLSRYYLRLYRINVFSTSLKIFWPVISHRLFIVVNSLVTSNLALISGISRW